ncbi:hypothetical protein V6N12_046197 [Hibiscus sabdariffa]|uniref:Uncharacterized protein n=1 Tax=Hibiscus sabdariffa TaxID=183260 RepID=A0ABR2APP7_9ROSI
MQIKRLLKKRVLLGLEQLHYSTLLNSKFVQQFLRKNIERKITKNRLELMTVGLFEVFWFKSDEEANVMEELRHAFVKPHRRDSCTFEMI